MQQVLSVPRASRTPIIRKVPATQAFSWLASGWSLFIGQPFQWALMALAVFVLMAIVSTVLVPLPIIGPMAAPVLFVLLTGGMLAGAERQAQGEALRFNHLFDGFRTHCGSLALVGLFYSIPLVLMSLVTFLALMGGLLAGLLGAVLGSALNNLLHGAVALVQAVATGWVVTVLVLLSMILALIYAPALIMYRRLPPLDSMLLSLRASFTNIKAMLVFGLLMYVLFAVSLIPAGLGVLIFIPVSVGAIRQAYLDMFANPEPELVHTAVHEAERTGTSHAG